MSKGLRTLYAIARDLARYVCPLCEKTTAEGKANLRRRCKHGSLTEGHWLWTCQHCGATHRDGAERLLK